MNKAVNILIKQHQQDEEIIESGLKAFYDVGSALMRIRDSKSYKEVDGYQTFEEYCQDKWDMKRTYAFYMIESSRVIDNLRVHNCERLPERESHVRIIAGLNPKYQVEVWQEVIRLSTETGRKITAKLVEEAMNEICAPDPEIVEEMERKYGSKDSSDERMDAEQDEQDYENPFRREAELKASSKGKKWHELNDDEKQYRNWDRYMKEAMEESEKAQIAFNEFLKRLGLDDASMQDFHRNFNPSSKALFHEFIMAGYRAMSMKHHPDHGGSTDKMSQISKINKFFKGYVDAVFD